MPLDPTVLGPLIKSQLEAVFGVPINDIELTNFSNAVALAVVSHIKSAALVSATGPVTGGAGGTATVTGTVS